MTLSLWKKRSSPQSLHNGDLTRLRDEMDRTIERFFTDPFAMGMVEPKDFRFGSWLPAIDVSESDAEITIRAEMPGVPAKELDVSISCTTLTIAGEKEESSERKDEAFHHCERRFGAFRRSIDLPESADPDKVTAESDNGVITIHVAKKPGTKPKQVEIKPAARKVPIAG